MRLTTAIAMALAMALPALALGAQDDEAVREVFAAYRSAVLARKGGEAAALVSQSTYDYYEGMRQLALYGEADAIRARPPLDQVQILMFRLRVPPEQLEAVSAEALIAQVVSRSWMGQDSVLTVFPGRVEVEGDAAILHAIVDGQDAGPAFILAREAGGWRLDLVPSAEASNASMREAAEKHGLSEGELVEGLTESVIGRKLPADAWTKRRSAPIPASQ